MKRLMLDPWKDLYSALLVMKWLMVDPWKDLSWTFFVMKRLKLDPWKEISSTLTRKLDRVIIVNIAPPPTRLLKSFHKSRSRHGVHLMKWSIKTKLFSWCLTSTFQKFNVWRQHAFCTLRKKNVQFNVMIKYHTKEKISSQEMKLGILKGD